MSVELRHLRAIVTLADELNFTRAAERLHLAQQALSSQIRQLEQRVGVKLVERTTRRVELTEAGLAFVGHARAALEQADAANAAATAVVRGERGELIVGLLAVPGFELTSEILRQFARDRPGITVSLRSIGWSSVQPLLSGEVDLCLFRPPVGFDGIDQLVLGSEPRVAVLPAGHRLAGREEVSVDDLLDEPWIWFEGAEQDRLAADFWTLADHRGGRPLTIGATASNAEDYFEAVRAGLAVGVSPAGLASSGASGLVFPTVRDAAPSLIALGWRSDDTRTSVSALVDAARRVHDAAVSAATDQTIA